MAETVRMFAVNVLELPDSGKTIVCEKDKLVELIENITWYKVYQIDDNMVQKNASVIVKRVPVQRLEAVTDQASGLTKEEEELTVMALAKLSKTADLAGAKASEDDKIKAMMKQSTEDFDPSTYQRRAPANYICYRCGGKGHFVRNCPTQGDARYNKQQFSNRQPSGIPREYMFLKMKQEKELLDTLRSSQPKNSHFTPVVSSDIVDHSKVPSDLQCELCKKLFTDAVVTPCCGESYCDDCIRNYLVENDLLCLCGETTSPDNLIANKSLRTSVSNFRNQKTAEMKSVPQSYHVNTQQNISSSNGSPVIKEEPRPESPYIQQQQQTTNEISEGMNGSLSYNNVPSPQVVSEPSLLDSPQRLQLDRNIISSSAVHVPVSNVAPNPTQSGLPVMPASLPVSVNPLVNASHVLAGSAGRAIYTNVQGSIHSGFPTVIGQQQLIQQPGLVGAGLPYGLTLPPGAHIVKRLVPIPVPGQRFIPGPAVTNHIRLVHPHPQQHPQHAQQHLQQRPPHVQQHPSHVPQPIQPRSAPVPVDMNQRMMADPAAVRAAQIAAARKDPESPMPLTEDEFYKWQMKFKTRPPARRRSRSKSPYRSRSKSPPSSDKRKRRRHRSTSPTDSGKGRYDSPVDDSSQERKAKKKKDKLKKRHRDSSQESVNGETNNKVKATRTVDKKTTRRLPEHIKREVDEFDFDNELEFDEELRKLKTKKRENDEGDEAVSSPGVENSPSKNDNVLAPSRERSHSGSLSKESESSVATPILDVKLEKVDSNALGTPTNSVQGDVLKDKSVKDETSLTDDKNESLPIDASKEESGPATDAVTVKPKRKTKIIKKKVIRVIKVSRKKVKNGIPTERKIISQTIIQKDGVPVNTASLPENSRWEVGDKLGNTEDGVISKRKNIGSKNESPIKKVRIDAQGGKPVSTKRSVSSKLLTPEKKKELLKKRQAENRSTVKAKQLFAEVQAKKEAEKKQLLERAKKGDDASRSKKELADAQEAEKKLREADEKKKKYDRYLLLKKKAKEKAIQQEKQRKAQKTSAATEVKSQKSSSSKKQTKDKKELEEEEEEEEEKKRPDQHFYKPGDAKLKTISDMTKKQLQEGGSKKRSEKGDSENGDVLKSKITSMKNVINSPEKRRIIKTSVSEEERDMTSSQSSDERIVRRVVKLATKKPSRGVVSKVEKIDSRSNRDASKKRSESVERRDVRHSRHQEEEDKRRESSERNREKGYERENRERKRLLLLEKEKEESLEREKYALREKERLERKLEKERQLRKDMEREKEDEDRARRKREDDKHDKRKLSRGNTDSEDETKRTGKRSKKNKSGYVIQIIDSENEVQESEQSSEAEESEKKRKKKSRKKKDKRKKKKKDDDSEDEESEESSEEEEDERPSSKKKKKKHKRKHKKHKSRSSRKHKKKSKKKKKKQEKSEDEESSNEGENENENSDDDDDDDNNTEEGEDSASDSKSEEGSTTVKEDSKASSSSEKSESETDEKTEKEEVKKSKKSKQQKSSYDETTGTDTTLKADDQSTEEASETTITSKKLKTTNKEETKTKERRKRSTLGDGEDIELDYNEDVDVDIDMDEDALLYGDLNFADDEQTNPESMDETTTTSISKLDDFEEGEILDDELFTSSSSSKLVEEMVENAKTEVVVATLKSKQVEIESTEIDEDDTELDDVIDDAMNNIELTSSKIGASESDLTTVTTTETSDKNENEDDDEVR